MCTCRWVWAGLMTEWVDGLVHVGGCVGWVGDWVGTCRWVCGLGW